jgi:putative transposase
MQRGVNKGRCFDDDSDRELYLGLLAELAPHHQCDVHAYVLMTNHVHLLVTPEVPPAISLLMRNVGQRYAQAYNRRHARTGPLWNDRFKTSLVDTESYLFVCYRYIELNPVRAGMVAAPEHYPWSSFCTNAWGVPSVLVRPRPEYLSLGSTPEERLAAYRALYPSGLTQEQLGRVRAAANANIPLGTEAFLDEIEARLRISARPGKPGRPPKQ